MDNMENKATKAQAIKIGEKIEFDRVLKNYVDTKYGAAVALKFIKNRKIVRSTFAGKGLLEWLERNPQAKSVTLVDQVSDGEYTHNIYE